MSWENSVHMSVQNWNGGDNNGSENKRKNKWVGYNISDRKIRYFYGDIVVCIKIRVKFGIVSGFLVYTTFKAIMHIHLSDKYHSSCWPLSWTWSFWKVKWNVHGKYRCCKCSSKIYADSITMRRCFKSIRKWQYKKTAWTQIVGSRSNTKFWYWKWGLK